MAGTYQQVSPEVYYSDGRFLSVSHADIAFLRDAASASPRKRCRLCFHESQHSPQQEMLIVMHRDAYVRPHLHRGKVETFSVIEGACDALLFDDEGNVTQSISMSPAAEGGAFFYRMPPGLFHTMIFRSEWLVFLETTIGPFDATSTEPAEWAPPETNLDIGRAYLDDAFRRAESLSSRAGRLT